MDLTSLGIVRKQGKLYTTSQYRDSVYGEDVRKSDGFYFREWEPKRSKVAAAILKRFDNLPFHRDSRILYLGASTGTTVSHLSDICNAGQIFAIEKAYDPFVKLLSLSQRRNNIYPILEDAGIPGRYRFFVERAEIIYQDVAQRNQVQIFNANAEAFPEAREALLILKIRAISSKGNEEDILKTETGKIEGFSTMQVINLNPYSKANYMLYLKRK
ncbi:MAG: fibrillarin-like rRNA/tRNA 2'-O-methyltransferase [Candidatus Thermoplasmatota archaeon]|nr:fibrillarin-like rRNA/tRNA 2'-O-methyltransferase [Candidatus Thermoplasmatota archaeon]MDA8142490.1 fibrillarin-like rRNA/tRNA 2'-O-methyltransferase [Thermoplasmatales archaeon]